MAEDPRSSPILGQLGQGPNNWYQSSYDPVPEVGGWQSYNGHGGSGSWQGSPSEPSPSPPQPFESNLGGSGGRCSIGHGFWRGLPPEPPPEPLDPILEGSQELRPSNRSSRRGSSEDCRSATKEERMMILEGTILSLNTKFDQMLEKTSNTGRFLEELLRNEGGGEALSPAMAAPPPHSSSPPLPTPQISQYTSAAPPSPLAYHHLPQIGVSSMGVSNPMFLGQPNPFNQHVPDHMKRTDPMTNVLDSSFPLSNPVQSLEYICHLNNHCPDLTQEPPSFGNVSGQPLHGSASMGSQNSMTFLDHNNHSQTPANMRPLQNQLSQYDHRTFLSQNPGVPQGYSTTPAFSHQTLATPPSIVSHVGTQFGMSTPMEVPVGSSIPNPTMHYNLQQAPMPEGPTPSCWQNPGPTPGYNTNLSLPGQSQVSEQFGMAVYTSGTHANGYDFYNHQPVYSSQGSYGDIFYSQTASGQNPYYGGYNTQPSQTGASQVGYDPGYGNAHGYDGQDGSLQMGHFPVQAPRVSQPTSNPQIPPRMSNLTTEDGFDHGQSMCATDFVPRLDSSIMSDYSGSHTSNVSGVSGLEGLYVVTLSESSNVNEQAEFFEDTKAKISKNEDPPPASLRVQSKPPGSGILQDSSTEDFSSSPEAIEDIRQGTLVIVVDDKDRESEGDLIMAASLATPEVMDFIVTHGTGIECVSMKGGDLDRLHHSLMVKQIEEKLGTAFTTSVDAKEGLAPKSTQEDETLVFTIFSVVLACLHANFHQTEVELSAKASSYSFSAIRLLSLLECSPACSSSISLHILQFQSRVSAPRLYEEAWKDYKYGCHQRSVLEELMITVWDPGI